MQTCVNTTNKSGVYAFSSDQRKWIAKLLKLHEKEPDKVQIIHMPEDNDGCIVANFPSSWMKISPPRQVSEQQRLAAAQRLSKAREKQR